MSNIAVLFLSSKTYPSERNSRTQKKIFSRHSFYKDFYWYKQGSEAELNGMEANLIGNDLFINADDSSIGMGHKTIKAFDWLLNNSNFEILFRTNTSSYVSYENLKKYVNENLLNKENVYSGKIYETNDIDKNKVIFASGSGYFLSRDVVEKIVQHKNLWDHRLWDDVSLGKMLNEINIKPIPGKRFDVLGNVTKQNIDLSHYHYRCRIDNHYNYPRFLEVLVINYLFILDKGKNVTKVKKIFLNILFETSRIFFINDFGWNSYLRIRSILRSILPKKMYKFIKKILNKRIENFKLIRFKI